MRTIAAVMAVAILGLAAHGYSPAKHFDPPLANPNLINVIEGTVYGPDHQPVPNLWVELLNELGMGNKRVRTESNGRYFFAGMGDGHYELKVYTSGTPFEEQTQTIEVINLITNGTGTFYQDVTLHYKKGAAGNTDVPQMTEAVFVQAIPSEAKRLYQLGVKDLGGKEVQKGQQELDEAIKVFPDYYDALNALGCNYVGSKEYQKSFPYLIHAIDVNQRSFSSFYSLAYAAYKTNRLPEASEAARGAAILQPNSVNAQLLYGTILRIIGNYDKSLEALSKAEKLSKAAPLADVHWQLFLLYSKLNKNKEAADQLETYLKIDPNTPNRKQVEDLIQKLRAKSATT
jgi:Tfp pilus assembly protein PilF